MGVILFLKANPYHDLKGRFAHAPESRGGGGGGEQKPGRLTLGAAATEAAKKRIEAAHPAPSPPRAFPKTSLDIRTEEEAKAYWQKHFKPGEPHAIRCQYGTRAYDITVTFGRNHAYTAGEEGQRISDEQRSFDVQRARGMDAIWEVLRQPHAVTWSDTTPGNKVFDRRLRLDHAQFGRIVLAPTPTPDDVERGRVSHYAFTSWHTPSKGQFDRVKERAAAERVNPYSRPAAMKKALPAGESPFTPRTLSAATREALPASEGFAFDWSAYFYAGQRPAGRNRTPEGADGDTESPPDYADGDGLFKALPAGARWITVHPNGRDEKGVPVMIQPAGDGAYRVVGGAGGKLNYLKLTGVKDASEYKAEAAKRAAARRDMAKQRRAEDKETGLHQARQTAKESVKAELKQHEARFVETVAKALGWTDADMRFPEEKFQNASDAARKKAASDHARELFRRAQEAVDTQRKRLVDDAEARAQAGLGEVPLTTKDPATLSVEDLAPVGNEGGGLGFTANYGDRAEKAGLTKDDLQAEADKARPSDKPSEQRAKARAERKEKAEAIQKELEGIRELPRVDPRTIVDAKKAVDLIKAKKALDAARKAGRAEVKRIEEANGPAQIEPKAFVIEVGREAVDDAVTKELENDLRTVRTRAFLDTIGEQDGGRDSLGKHIGVGAFNSVNALALAAGGNALLDRSVVDVLGPAGAAQVLARRLASDLTADEFEQVREAMGRFHVNHYMATSAESLRAAREWQEMAAEIEIGEVANAADLRVAQEMNAKRREFVGNAQRVLGQALGEMETNAALVTALEAPKKDQLTVSLGKTSPEDAIRQARAIGLERGDYQVEKIGGSTMLTVNAAGQDRLAQPVNRDDLARVRRALDIIEGRQDEDDWLPKGVAKRPDMAMDIKEGVAPRIAKEFPRSPADIEGAITDYIGGRAADGDSPAHIVRDLLSEEMIQRAGNRDAFMAAVNKLAPLYDADGKMVRAEAHADAFEKMADRYVARLGGDRSPLHRQAIAVDDTSVDALHRALAEHPDGVAAFKPVGELTPQDQGALRKVFLREHGRTDANAESLRQDLERHEAAEPEKETDGLFGRATNPEWTDWQARRDQLTEQVNQASMTWPKYVAVMGSPGRAYAAMQDVVRSDVLRAFAGHHNRLRPDQPLRIGRTAIAHDLDHLDALDPDARERRLADHRDLVDRLRNRVAGRYASGSVQDKVSAAREADAAAEQAQMGLFGAMEDPAPAEAEAPVKEEPLELGQRWTIGHAAERQVAGMMDHVGAMFRAGRPVKLWQPSMSGKYVARQRAVKLIRANKRMMLGMGTGSGKTSIMMAGFADAHGDGAAKKGIFAVPSVVQGQFHGEALTLLEPGKFRWHADPAATREERIAAYKDPDTHFSVVTHQALRDDLLHLAAKQESVTPAAIADKLDRMQPAERSTYMKDMLAKEGIPWDYLAVDEGHNLLNRAGKDNSRMANVIDAVSSNMGHYVSATADPVKNDACLHPDTPLTDAISGETMRVADWYQQGRAPRLWALDVRSGRARVIQAHIPFIKSRNRPMFRVSTAAGHSITVAADHRFLTPQGWTHLSDFAEGQLVAAAPPSWPRMRVPPIPGGRRANIATALKSLRAALRSSVASLLRLLESAGASLPTVLSLGFPGQSPACALPTGACAFASGESRKGALSSPPPSSSRNARSKCDRHCCCEDAGYPGRCCADLRLCDEPLHLAQDTGQEAPPSPSDARPPSRGCLREGAQEPARGCMPRPDAARPSIEGDPLPCASHSASLASGNTRFPHEDRMPGPRQAFRRLWHRLFHEASSRPEPFARSSPDADRRAPRHPHDEDASFFTAVVSVEQVENADIYDLEVPDLHNYLACGLWHHNTEAFDVLAKMDPARYSDRDAFMRRYGVDTTAAKEGLRREMVRHFYTAKIDPGVKADRKTIQVDLSPDQHETLSRLDKAAADARLARMSGKVDVAAMRTLSPTSFDAAPEAQHEEVAKNLQRSIGIIHNTAVRHAVNGGAKFDRLAAEAKARKGKQGVVFVHSLDHAKQIADRLATEGHRVVTMTGADSSQEKDRKKAAFQGGDHDIIVMSDAGAVGANLQKGKWLAQVDTPDTAMTHAQRGARIHRFGQQDDVELLDLVANHPTERRARDRLAKKYALREVMTSPLEGLDDTGIAGMLAKVRAGKAEAEQPAYMPAGAMDMAAAPPPDQQQSLF